MAKTFEQLVQDTLGAQTMTICKLQSEIDSLHARIKELEAEQEKAKDAAKTKDGA